MSYVGRRNLLDPHTPPLSRGVFRTGVQSPTPETRIDLEVGEEIDGQGICKSVDPLPTSHHWESQGWTFYPCNLKSRDSPEDRDSDVCPFSVNTSIKVYV